MTGFRGSHRSRSLRERGLLWGLLGLSLAGIVGLAVFLGMADENGGTRVEPPGTPPAMEAAGSERLDELAPPVREIERHEEPESPPAGVEQARLRGRVEFSELLQAPASWKVLVRDPAGELVSEALGPSEAAEFAFDLAAGDYELQGEAPGQASFPEQVHLDGGAEVRLVLSLEPLAVLSGAVVSGASPAAGLPLSLLRSKSIAGRTATDPLGGFRFEPVPQGEYQLVLGDPAGPILPPETVAVVAPLTRLEDLTLPELGSLFVQVVDETGAPVSGALVEGSGDRGGSIRGESDAHGALRADFLPAGMYRVFASAPSLGRGNRILQFEPSAASPVEIRLLRARPPR